MGRLGTLALLFTLTCCCRGDALELSPASGPSFGHFEVRATGEGLEALGDPLSVTIGGIAAYQVTREGTRAVRFMVQGSPQPGVAEVVIAGPGGSLGGATLEYAPPRDARLARMVAFGASLTQGMQSGGFSARSQLHGPASLVARAAGAYLSLPLVKQWASLAVEDFDPSSCALKPGTTINDLIVQRFMGEVMKLATGPDGRLEIARLRIDPSLEVRNVAIGGMKLAQYLEGARTVGQTLLEHLVWNPRASADELLYEPGQTMVDRVVALQPTLIICADLFINDYNNVDVGREGIPDTSVLTPPASVAANLEKLLARLDATGAEIFIANGPDNTVIPYYTDKAARLRQQGYSEAEATGWIEEIRARVGQYNQALVEAAARRPRVHLVDFRGAAARIFKEGVDIGGTHLSATRMGGLLSLDGMHFTDTGYALLAQEFIHAINGALRAGIPELDLVQIMSEDPLSVGRLRAAGYACAGR